RSLETSALLTACLSDDHRRRPLLASHEAPPVPLHCRGNRLLGEVLGYVLRLDPHSSRYFCRRDLPPQARREELNQQPHRLTVAPPLRPALGGLLRGGLGG